MPLSDYEIYRQRLEEQLRADVELLYEAYRAKLRAYETVLRTRAEIGAGPWPTPDLTLSLPPAPGLQETAPATPALSKRPRSKAYSVIEAVEGVLDTPLFCSVSSGVPCVSFRLRLVSLRSPDVSGRGKGGSMELAHRLQSISGAW